MLTSDDKWPLNTCRARTEKPHMNEIPALIGACTNCIAPASLVATFATILIGAIIATFAERRTQRPAKVKISSELRRVVDR